MKKMQMLLVAGLVASLTVPAFAAASGSGGSPVHVFNRLRLGYDDNIYQVDNDSTTGLDKTDSFRIIEEVEFLVNLNLERAYVGLRYRPVFTWYADREDEDSEWLHDLDVNLSYNFTPSLMLSLSDTLRASQLPELQDENYIVRENDDNYYNSALATLSYNLRPETRIDVSGRLITLTYSDDSPNKDDDNYYSVVGGLTFRQQLASRSTFMGDVRYQTLRYNDAPDTHNRDADTIYAGVGLEQTFSPQLIGSLRGGVQNRQYDNEYFDDNTQPYVEASATFLPTPATRFTLSGSYSIYESDVANYLSQDRAQVSLSLAHDFTAKLSVYASSSYTHGAYDADYALTEVSDSAEDTVLFSGRIAYRVNRINWLEAGYQYTALDSDVSGRESYQRNRVDIGWRVQLF